MSPSYSYSSNISTQKHNIQKDSKNNKITLKANMLVAKKIKDNK